MPEITPDFSEVADPVEPGTYKVRIVGAEQKESQKGTPMIKWQFETFGEEIEKNNGRKISDQTPTAGKGAFRVQQLYKAVTGEKLNGAFDTDQLMGCELEITVDENENGYPDVKSYRTLGS